MQNSKNKLPKRQAATLYQFRPIAGFMETTTNTSSNDPTTTTSTIVTTTHIFGL